ncbi:MAG: dihydrodipicolinate synthase family protein, partial [Candidatus Omnitrophota bacterium]
GATGVVSVVANIIPGKVHELVQFFLDGHIDRSREIHFEIMDLCKAMFIETNPIPVKTSMAMMDMINEEWRLPLCEMSDAGRTRLEQVLRRYGLVK